MSDDTDADEDLGWYEEAKDFPKGKETWTNKTPVKGKFKISFPWFGGPVILEWPASGRQAMLEIVVACLATVTFAYVIFVGAVPENISRFGQMVRRSAEDSKPERYREPEQMPIKTNDGIEIIEVCLPCGPSDCERDCPCLTCPVQVPCPICPVTKTDDMRMRSR